jgi:hypothetical protein
MSKYVRTLTLKCHPLGLLIVGTFAVILSCKAPSNRILRPSDPNVPEQVFHASDLVTYALSDPQCDPANEIPSKIEAARLTRWQDGSLGQEDVDISHLNIRTTPLSSDAVAGVFMDAVFRRNCDASVAGPPNCQVASSSRSIGWGKVSPGTPMKACRASMAPPRGSLEHLALSAITALEEASLALKSLLPAGTAIAPVTVMVAPRFESLWMPWIQNGKNVSYELVLGDNLSYFPPTSDTPPYIALLPKRKRTVETTNLWESAFVLAHEYAHHVERSLKLDHFDQPRSPMRIAVSEGFADILSFASLGLSSRSLKGLPCLGTDRSPDQGEFNFGTPKIITSTLLDRMSESSSLLFQDFTTTDDCQGTLPYSSHGVGAIFAHWIFELASYTPPYAVAPAKAVANLSITWLKLVESGIAAGSTSPNKDLEKIAVALEAAVTQQFAAENYLIPENTRALLRQKFVFAFPALTDVLWFSGNHQ